MRTIACFAATLDGKIGSAANRRDRVGSRADLAHLMTVRNQADALLYGGETFRQHPLLRKGSQQSIAPLQCLLTRTFDMPAESPLFQDSLQTDSPSPIMIISPAAPPPDVKARYPQHIEWLTTVPGNPIPLILANLEQKGINTLMLEGGGHIMNLFLEARALQELYLTVCPLLLGGNHDPTLVNGPGFRVAEAPHTEVISSEWRGAELYLHLKLHYSSP